MIPKILHTIWVGGPMPDHLERYVQTWRDNHPGWEHRHWTGFDWLTNQHLYDTAEEHTPWVGQFRADLARYEILLRHGGVYVDVDFESLRPIDGLLDVAAFCAWEVEGVWANNAILGATPGHRLFADLVDGIPANVRRRRGKRPNVMTGPHYLTPKLHGRDVTVYPARWFYPYTCTQLDRISEQFPDAYAVHHWNRKRTVEGAWGA